MKSHPCITVALIVATASGLLAQAAPPIPRQTPAETVTMEAFTVTGTNIKRLDQEKVLPVTVFNIEQIEIRNALTPVEMLTALPQVTNIPLNESQNGGANSRGDNANVNLRGIGAGNTLVLLNGRRLAPHPVTSNDGGVPAFYTATSHGTLLARGKEEREFNGKMYVLEHALKGDVALVEAWEGDRWGNLAYRDSGRNFNPVMAMAAEMTIAQVAHLRDLGQIDPEKVHTPGIFVQRVVHFDRGAPWT
jgi:hypothetical protein